MRQQYRCAITGLPLEDTSEIVRHHVVARQVGGNDDWSNLCLVHKWAQVQLWARYKEVIRQAGLTHVRTSPYYPQSNGKLERYHRTVKGICLRPGSFADADEVRRALVKSYCQ